MLGRRLPMQGEHEMAPKPVYQGPRHKERGLWAETSAQDTVIKGARKV